MRLLTLAFVFLLIASAHADILTATKPEAISP